MIELKAVDPDEQGRGHMSAVIEMLVNKYSSVPLVENTRLITYDAAKAEIYEKLGFEVRERIEDGALRVWLLEMPIPVK